MENDVTPAEIRAKAAEALKSPGERRKRLRAEMDAVEAELRPLIVKAVRAEVSTRQIQQLTGISRPTIAKLVRDTA